MEPPILHNLHLTSVRHNPSKILFSLYQTPLLKEGNTIAQNMIILVFVFFGIHLFIYLLKHSVTILVHLSQNSGIFCFKHSNASIDRIINYDIAPAFAMFLIRFHYISGSGKNAC